MPYQIYMVIYTVQYDVDRHAQEEEIVNIELQMMTDSKIG